MLLQLTCHCAEPLQVLLPASHLLHSAGTLRERPCAVKLFHDDQPLKELRHELEAQLKDTGRACCVAVLGVCLGDADGDADSMDVDSVPPALITDLMSLGGLHRKAWCAAAVCWGRGGRVPLLQHPV